MFSTNNGLLTSSTTNNNRDLRPIIIYSNVESNKLKILSNNKGRVAIYMWTVILLGKRYVGSSVDLSNRLKIYFSKAPLNQHKNSYIYKALLY